MWFSLATSTRKEPSPPGSAARAWFDARVSDDAARIAELERGFRRDGLPNLILDFSAAEDVFTRAIPFLTIVFVLEIVNAMDVEKGWVNLLLALGGAAILVGAFGVLNVARGRRFLSVPARRPAGVDRVRRAAGTADRVVAVPVRVQHHARERVPAAARVPRDRVRCRLARPVDRLLRPARGVAVGTGARSTVAALLLPRDVLHDRDLAGVHVAGAGAFWTAMALFVLLAMVFLAVRLPGVVREVQESRPWATCRCAARSASTSRPSP